MNLTNKKIMVIDNGSFFSTALSLTEYFKEVLYYVQWTSGFPGMDKYVIGTEWKNGKKLDNFDSKPLRRIDSIWNNLKDIDVILICDVYDGDIADHLRELGYPVVHAGYNGAELELDRWMCKGAFKSQGMDVNQAIRIVGIDALRNHLEKVKDKFIKISRFRKLTETFHHENYILSLPILQKLESELGPMAKIMEFIVEDPIEAITEEGFDAFTVSGEYPKTAFAGAEIKDKSYYGEIMPYDKLSKGIKKTNEQIAPLLKKCEYKGFFSTEVRTTKDNKNYLIDMTCFSDDTEVLTKEGWKLFKDCNKKDQFCTLDSDKNIEYQEATNFIDFFYNGKMIHFTNEKNTYDQLVTPEHDILRYDRNKKKLFKETAKNITDKGYIPRTGNWLINEEEYFILPSYYKEWDSFYHQICDRPEVKINLEDWACFLGWYLSEGSTGNGFVNISQFKYQDKVEEVLKKLPFYYKKTKSGFQIQSTQLQVYLDQFGICNQKYIPDYIKNSSSRIISIFLESYRWGDGSHELKKNGELAHLRIFTTSKKMADDIQECALKIGTCANISKKNMKGTMMIIKDKKSYMRNHDIYCITQYIHRKDYWFETGCRKERYIRELEYHGNVYCVTVPNGTLYVRRNGKPTWSGNCREPMPPSPLYGCLFANLGDIVWGLGNSELVDIKPKYKCGLYLTISSDWYDEHHQAIYFPKEYRDNIKLSYPLKIDDVYYCLNINCFPEVGSVVTVGNSYEECYKQMEKIIPEIKGYGIKIDLADCQKAYDEFLKMQKQNG